MNRRAATQTVNSAYNDTGVNRYGLSSLQKRILEILPARPRQYTNEYGNNRLDPPLLTLPRNEDIIKALGLRNGPSARASVSRALARLAERKLAMKWVGTLGGLVMLGPGQGGRWSLSDSGCTSRCTCK
jgi:hypothetical protein